MPYKGTKRINENIFNNLKTVIAAQGVTATQADTGYSLRTIKSIKHAADYEAWRTARKRPKQATDTKPAQAPTSKTLPQAPTARELKKPGHAFVPVTHKPAAAPVSVTRESELSIKVAHLDSYTLDLFRRLELLEDRVKTLEGDAITLDYSEFDRFADTRPWWRKLVDKLGSRF